MKKVLSFAYFFFFAWLLFSVTAFAYIDPSAMTYIIQLIAGIAIAAGAGVGFYFRKLKRKFFQRGTSYSRTAAQVYDEDDDDDTGYGDYELDTPAQPQQIPFSAFQTAEVPASPVQNPVYAYAAEPVNAPADPFDEAGGAGSLAAENRELRRLLADERQKVEDLKRALHICTAAKR